MQTIGLILVASFAALGVPLILIAFTSYTLYYSIFMADYAQRRNETMFKAVVLGRRMSARLKSHKIHESSKHVLPKETSKSQLPTGSRPFKQTSPPKVGSKMTFKRSLKGPPKFAYKSLAMLTSKGSSKVVLMKSPSSSLKVPNKGSTKTIPKSS